MITSTSVQKHLQTGIIKLIINTEYRWIDYSINAEISQEEGKLTLSHFYDIETQPGCFDTQEDKELIYTSKEFNPFKYTTYSRQEKDQIVVICIPNTFMLDKDNWKFI